MQTKVQQLMEQAADAVSHGRLREARALYQSILSEQPDHPDALHNLGVLAVSVGLVTVALPLLKFARDSRPMVEQFWISYVDALIKTQQFDLASQELADAKQSDQFGASHIVLSERISLAGEWGDGSQVSLNLTSPASKLPSHEGFPHANSESIAVPEPSQAMLDELAGYYETGRLDQAENLRRMLAAKFPQHPAPWRVAASALAEIGRVSEAIAAVEECIKLSPTDPKMHNDLGRLLQRAGKLQDALGAFQRAVAIKPDFLDAHFNLGTSLQELGFYDQAEKSYEEVLRINPKLTNAHYNLGNLFEKTKNYSKAISSYRRALMLEPELDRAQRNLAILLSRVTFSSSDRSMYPLLVTLLTDGKHAARPAQLAGAILSLASQDPVIAGLREKPIAVSAIEDALHAIRCIMQVPPLLSLMQVCPFPDVWWENFFGAIRRSILLNLDVFESHTSTLDFQSCLALHCFTNEFVFRETSKETRAIEDLAAKLADLVERGEQPSLCSVLCFAAYRPLHRFEWSSDLTGLASYPGLKARLLDEPFMEREISEGIPTVGAISDNVSIAVQEQYEKNPYPRWVSASRAPRRSSFGDFIDAYNIKLNEQAIRSCTYPDVLVAGCGTGQHSVERASSLPLSSRFVAVDLSRTSLAYAYRKTQELGIENITYFQADILELEKLEKKFDLIECGGVLHHMHDPLAGWRVLVSLLKPAGLMKIGLYSQLARQDIELTRNGLSWREMSMSPNGLRELRHSLMSSDEPHHKELTKWPDFYSLSSFRDLVVHTQEHRYTIPMLKHDLEALALAFCGFDNRSIVDAFADFYGQDADALDLDLWHEFETANPRTFGGMYQFWAQKT